MFATSGVRSREADAVAVAAGLLLGWSLEPGVPELRLVGVEFALFALTILAGDGSIGGVGCEGKTEGTARAGIVGASDCAYVRSTTPLVWLKRSCNLGTRLFWL